MVYSTSFTSMMSLAITFNPKEFSNTILSFISIIIKTSLSLEKSDPLPERSFFDPMMNYYILSMLYGN